MDESVAIAVRHALKINPAARESDLAALFTVWEMQGFSLTPEQRKLLPALYRPGTVIRTRARLQNSYGMYVAQRRRKGTN